MSHQDLPTGLIAFLFSDIENSTRLWERHGQGMPGALTLHDKMLQSAVAEHNGSVVKMTGDGAYAIFAGTVDAIDAAVALQRRLQAQPWFEIEPDSIRVRVGIHVGEAQLRDGDYHGSTLNIAARLMSAGHGGQILVSEAAALMARLPEDLTLQKLGRYHLKGIGEPQTILQLTAPDLPSTFPELNAQTTAVRNLPGQTTPFIGRRRELEEVRRILLETDGRLLTLVGPGGMGKTRLAVAAAESIAAADGELFADGVTFVPLASVDDAGTIGRSAAGALGYSLANDDTPPNRQLLPLISDKRMLLILDNLEHLMGDELATFLDTVLGAAPGVKLLATSRERANLRAETVFAVGGMDEPGAGEDVPILKEDNASDAVQLFIQSARRSLPGFELTVENTRAIEQICHLAGGMPLGIELAAGWLGVLSPQEIAAELQKSLDLLSTTMRDVPGRQRSLRAVFDGYWARLSAQEQEAFLRLSVFRGGFQRSEGEAAAGVSLPILLALVNKSFLQREAGGRFNLHEQMRYFANELLRRDEQKWQEAKRRHSDAYAGFVARQLPRLRGPQQKEARADVESDFDNIRVAWARLVAQGSFDELIEQMLPGVYNVAIRRMRFAEFQHLLDNALEQLVNKVGYRESVPYLILQTAVIDLYFNQLWHLPFLYPEGKALLQELWPAAIRHRREMGEWFDLFLLHHILNVGEEKAQEQWEDHIADLRDLGDEWRLAYSLNWFAFALRITEIERMRPFDLVQEACSLFNKIGDAFRATWAVLTLGWMTDWRGDYQHAVEYMQQAQQLMAGQGVDLHRGRIIHEIGNVTMRMGQPHESLACLVQEQAIYRRLNRLDRLKQSLHWESIIASRFSSLDHAFRTREESMALGRRIARSLGLEEANLLDWDYFELAELNRVAGDLSQARHYYQLAGNAFAAASSLTGQGFHQRGLGDLALAEGHPDRAESNFRHYLAHARATRSFSEELVALIGLGRALTRLDRPQESADILAEAIVKADNPAFIDFVLWPIVALAELKTAQEDYSQSALLAAYVLHHPLAWLEMRDLMEDLLQTIEPHLGANFDRETAAQEARST